ncbi:PFA4 [Candida pseudojiufengensis]|uniref:PFA4 n=1 Tax=Candida pseudojiufengensis TaxID=497109 RepID=UPI0022258CCE|nr:PFA4 [Candida pseudojiufengensis]KAI5959842.1 PFA4 [Candida pseudojiufengensis]
MVLEFKWPILGVIIPCIVIAILSYGSHIFILYQHLSFNEQIIYELIVSMIWLTYILAIYKSPGNPPANYKPKQGEWKRYCSKCKNYKPPRTHHCSKCKKCILSMDHHCPWTLNCVGHENLPHFMRFLVWVIIGTSYLFIQQCYRIIDYYNNSDLPIYLIDKKELIAVIALTPINLFVLISISFLFLRCFINICKGMTQIEIWEWDRIESQFNSNRLWGSIKLNYKKLHDKELPKLSTWTNYREEQEDQDDVNEIPQNFTIDDLIFPYDYGIWQNLKYSLGNPLLFWLIPWFKSKYNGYDVIPSIDYKEDDQLNLPWPPDGGNNEIEIKIPTNEELKEIKNYKILKQKLDPRNNLKRSEWSNDMGENLGDYGVDIDDSEDDKL